MEKELAKEFVLKYPNLFTTDKWFWEIEIEKFLLEYKTKLIENCKHPENEIIIDQDGYKFCKICNSYLD